jgi:hypothetical protein
MTAKPHSRGPRVGCLICGAPGKRIELVGKAAIAGCPKHENALRMGTGITGAAVKAGVITAMEMTRPGLYQGLGELYGKIREVFGPSKEGG